MEGLPRRHAIDGHKAAPAHIGAIAKGGGVGGSPCAGSCVDHFPNFGECLASVNGFAVGNGDIAHEGGIIGAVGVVGKDGNLGGGVVGYGDGLDEFVNECQVGGEIGRAQFGQWCQCFLHIRFVIGRHFGQLFRGEIPIFGQPRRRDRVGEGDVVTAVGAEAIKEVIEPLVGDFGGTRGLYQIGDGAEATAVWAEIEVGQLLLVEPPFAFGRDLRLKGGEIVGQVGGLAGIECAFAVADGAHE